MTTNKYFRPFTYGRQQDLAEDLIIQAIKIYGLDVKYLPRTLNNPDPLLGEDPASSFDYAVDIEMYIKGTSYSKLEMLELAQKLNDEAKE